jgi:hypothetical protein
MRSPVEDVVDSSVSLAGLGLSRRDLLARGSALVGGLGLLPWLGGCATLPVEPPTPTAELPWEELRRSLSGPLLRPGDRAYLARALPWNRRYARTRPAGIAVCQKAEDVQASLRWARKYEVPLVVRSGGHSYAGYSTTEGLMLDVSSMNGVSFDPATGRATVGGGARNANVYASLRPLQRAVTHGRCLGVGVAGLVLGGGIGFNMRLHGLTCDGLVATEMVLASGERVICDRDRNADLFWASRGAGGGNYGIHTSFTFETFSVPEITVFSLQWTTALEDVFGTLLALLPRTPNRLGAKVSVNITPDGALSVNLLGQLVGPPSELRSLLEPAYAVAKPTTEQVSVKPYWDGQTFLSEEGCPEYSHESSRFGYKDLPSAAVATIFSYLRRWPGTSIGADWKSFLVGGTVNDKGRDETAYVHRGAIHLTSIEVEWNAEDAPDRVAENLAWQAEFHEAMGAYTSNEAFQNFIDPVQKDYLRAYYAENLEQLVEIKRRHDPGNVFRYPQSIPVRL